MKRNKGTLVFAMLLILTGAWYLLVELVPDVKAFAYGSETWPLQVVGLGGLLALAGLLTWTPGLFIPACVVGGIGGLLFWQNLTGNWESWAYTWTLIPGFAGAGLVLFGVFRWRRKAIAGGLWSLLISLALFGVFGAALGHLPIGNLLWPAGLILLGIVVFIFPSLRRDRAERMTQE